MEVTEMNNSLEVLLISKKARTKSLQEEKSVFSIRAALDRYLCLLAINKKFSICVTIQFNEANKALNSYLKHIASTAKIAGTVHKNPLTVEVVQKLFEAGENWRVRKQKILSLCCRQHGFTFLSISVKEVDKIKV